MFSLHNPEPENDQGLKEYFGSIWEHIKDRRVLGLFVGTLVTFAILFGSLITYLPILMNEFFGASPLVIGVVVASSSLTTALVSTQVRRLSSRFSEQVLIRLSFLVYAGALCVVPLAPSAWVLLVPTIVFGVAQSLNLPNAFSLLTAAAPKENRGAFLALNSTILRLGQTVGPLLMSVAAAGLGLGGAYFAVAGLAAAMSLVAFVLIR